MQLKRNIDEPIHSRVLPTLRDVDALQIEQDLWESAVSKWQLIFQLVSYVGPVCERLLKTESKVVERGIIRDVLGIKSPRTASKRADSLRKFFTWCQQKQCAIWPVYASRVLAYLSGDDGKPPAATTGLALLEAFRFCRFVMGIDVGDDVLNDPQLKGKIGRLLVEKSNCKQARPLLCSEVAMMERFVCNGEKTGDVYLVGCCLFALFERCRWSDLRFLDCLTEDRVEGQDEIYGFLESSTAIHKTSASAERKQRCMPIVVPLLGVTGMGWASAWLKSAGHVGMNFESSPLGGSGMVGQRSCASTEITRFLNAFLKIA